MQPLHIQGKKKKKNPLHIHFYAFMMVKNMFLYITFDDYNFKTEIYFMRFVRQQFFTIFLFFYIFKPSKPSVKAEGKCRKVFKI